MQNACYRLAHKVFIRSSAGAASRQGCRSGILYKTYFSGSHELLGTLSDGPWLLRLRIDDGSIGSIPTTPPKNES